MVQEEEKKNKRVKKRLKEIKKNDWFIYKFKFFIFLIILIISSLLIVIYQCTSSTTIINIFASSILNISIIAIPIFLCLNNIRKNYQSHVNQFYLLKEELIMIRYEISEKILNKSTLSKPILINSAETLIKIKELLRYFNYHQEANTIHYIIKQNRLYIIDHIIIRLLKDSKNLDHGKEFNRTMNEISSYKSDLERDLGSENFEKDYNPKFIENFAYVLVYHFCFEKIITIPVQFYYMDGLESYDIMKVNPDVRMQRWKKWKKENREKSLPC
ncbi:MAG: hypothetical protein ACTSVV_05790 [Promethearchaeota archaeon]